MSFTRQKEPIVNVSALHCEVTGSCLLVDVHYPDGENLQFIVDCGLFQERMYTQLNEQSFPFDSKKIKFAFITHNHADHNGRLPILMKEGFKGKIYTTKTTRQLMYHSLMDDYKIMLSNTKEKHQKPWYSEVDVQNVMTNTVDCLIDETVYVDKRIKATFLDNGHLLGAASIFIQISYFGKNDKCILFSGDYKGRTIWKEVQGIPDWIKQTPKVVVMESTYGYMDSCEVEYRFKDDVQEILGCGKSLLAFVNAQGRTQEVLAALTEMQNNMQLSKNIPIYLDGNLAQIYTKIYHNSSEIDEDKRNFIPENFILVNKENREEVIFGEKQKIILTTSGMADHGPACIYVPALIEREDYAFYFTSYVTKDSLAYKIQNPQEGTVKINGVDYSPKVKVYSTPEFSSHAKADELLHFLKEECGNVQCVLINHGEKKSQILFGQKVIEAGIAKHVETLSEHTAIIGEGGLIKVIGSKFYSISKTKQDVSDEKKSIKKSSKVPFVRMSVCRR